MQPQVMHCSAATGRVPSVSREGQNFAYFQKKWNYAAEFCCLTRRQNHRQKSVSSLNMRRVHCCTAAPARRIYLPFKALVSWRSFSIAWSLWTTCFEASCRRFWYRAFFSVFLIIWSSFILRFSVAIFYCDWFFMTFSQFFRLFHIHFHLLIWILQVIGTLYLRFR